MTSNSLFCDFKDIMDKNDQDTFDEILNNLNLAIDEEKPTQNCSTNNSDQFDHELLIEDNTYNNIYKCKSKSKAFIQKELKNSSYKKCIKEFNIIDNITDNLNFLKKCKNKEEILKTFTLNIKEEEETDYKTKNYDINENSEKKSCSLSKSRDINIKNYYFTNEMSDVGANKGLKFTGKKRFKKPEVVNNENEDILLEIKNLYEKYNRKDLYYKLYQQDKGVFEKNITVVEEGIPVCVIYLFRNMITQIFLITEQLYIEDKSEIFDVLNDIKNNIKNFQNLNQSYFKKL
jgi:hypothetical protein